ncbi:MULTISPECIES: hypothetical protein [unclassified Pseudomonas]|uniref:hypothetical protein n=1 Tax=unclassified Pseudomonas TaxID=196821 RepID=UPI00131ACD02|nr:MULTISPECIES: hypothetical protein [unclassified Pseudomonas]
MIYEILDVQSPYEIIDVAFDKGYAVFKRFDSSYGLIKSYPHSAFALDQKGILAAVYQDLSTKLVNSLISPIIMKYENFGAAFTHITPDQKDPKSLKHLRGHTDGAFLHFPTEKPLSKLQIPELIGLYCIRNPGNVCTTVYPLDDVLDGLPDIHIDTLLGENYLIGIQASWNMPRSFILHERPRSLLAIDKVSGKYFVRFSHSKVLPLSPKAKLALNFFKDRLPLHEKNISLIAGDLLIINNMRSIYGRSTAPNEDSVTARRRWLLRFYARSIR